MDAEWGDVPTLSSPLKLYQKLFIEDTETAKAATVRRILQDRSLLDGLRAQYRALQRSVSAADRDRQEQFATGVRDAEKRLAATEGWVNVPKPKVTAPAPSEITDRNDLPKNTRAMYDLLRLALETDSTRVITFCGCVTSIVPTTIPGVKTQVHTLSHHGQHLAFNRKENYPLSNLSVSPLQRMGIEAKRFSGGTGTMRGLEMA